MHAAARRVKTQDAERATLNAERSSPARREPFDRLPEHRGIERQDADRGRIHAGGDVLTVNHHLARLLAEGNVVAVFPEGTTTFGG